MGLKNFLKTWITKSDTIVSLPKLPDYLPDYQQPELTRTNNAGQLRIALAGGFQGGPITNHFEEAKHVEGFSYISIHAISMQLHRATVSAYWDGEDQDKNQSQRKSLQSVYGTRWKAAYGADELEKITLERNHALMQLLAKPNPIEPGGMFRYRESMQIRTTGGSFIWNCPNVFGRTCQRYVVPTTAITPIWPCANLPKGGYRIQPNCMRWIPLNDEGYVRGMPALTRVLGMVIPAEYMQKVGFPHPMWLDDFYSPMSAGSQWVDAERAINIARTAGVSNSMTPNIHVELPETSENIDQDVLTITKRMWDKGYGGPNNFGRSMVTPFGTKVTQLSGGKTDMGYHDGYTDTKEAVLALHGTPPVAIGIQEAGALAAYNASLIQFGHTTVQPLCDVIAEADTHVIAPQFGDGITIEIEHQKVNDESATNAKVEIAVRAGSIKKDTVCALLGIEALGGTEGQKLAAPVQQPKDKESGTQRSEDADDHMPAPPIAPSVDNPMGRTEMNTPTSKTLLAALDGMKEADDELLTERIDRIVESRLKAMKGSNPIAAARRVGEWLKNCGQAMPGYGDIYLKENGSGEAWYVGGDGDDRGFDKLVKQKLMSIEGIDEVYYESECRPPENEGWIHVYPSSVKAMKARDADKPYKFSSTQINLPESLAKKVIDVGRLIPDSELADDGRENDIHVTCLYGIHSSNPADVSMAITSFGQFEIELGKTSYFECDGYDVVKIDVISPKLVELHDNLCDSTAFTSTHLVYRPHATIAYVASGCGKKYSGISLFEGDKFTAESVVFTSTDKKRTTIQLEPTQRKSLGMSGSIGSDGGFAVMPEVHGEMKDHENGSDPSYGNCPFCGKPGMERERRVDGNTKCEDGHIYPSTASVFDRAVTKQFDESKHPRGHDGNAGEFSSAQGSSEANSPEPPKQPFNHGSAIPQTLYHGSRQTIDKFNDDAYLTLDKNVASQYGSKVNAAVVSVKRVFRPSTIDQIEKASGVKRDPDSNYVFEELDRPKVRDALKKKGYDAVEFEDIVPNSDNDTHHAVIVFDGNKIQKVSHGVRNGKVGIGTPRVKSPTESVFNRTTIKHAGHDVSGENRDHGKFAVTAGSGKKTNENHLRVESGHVVPDGSHVDVAGTTYHPGEFIHSHQLSSLTPDERKKHTESLAGKKLDRVYRNADTGEGLSSAHEAEVRGLKIRPDLKNVTLMKNEHGELKGYGTDSKGRRQPIYPTAHHERAKAEKFERLKEFQASIGKIRERMASDLSSPDEKTREGALLARLIEKTGIRVGSDKDTGAEKKATGATTLEPKHVQINGDHVTMEFVGKSGHDNHWEVTDPVLAKAFAERIAAGKNRLFSINDTQFRNYMHDVAPRFKPAKDFRTAAAADHASAAVDQLPEPKTALEYREALGKVAEHVSKNINNTPDVAYSSYIPPEVFGQWQANLLSKGIDVTGLKPSYPKATSTAEPSKSPPKKVPTGGTKRPKKETPSGTQTG